MGVEQPLGVRKDILTDIHVLDSPGVVEIL